MDPAEPLTGIYSRGASSEFESVVGAKLEVVVANGLSEKIYIYSKASLSNSSSTHETIQGKRRMRSKSDIQRAMI